MPSPALTGHLLQLLGDAGHLEDARDELAVGVAGRPARRAAINRAIVVTCLSAWEAYIEELVRVSLDLLRPAAPPLGLWPALNATVRGQLGRFNTPSTDNVRLLISDVIGLPDIQTFWMWRNCTSAQAVQRLAEALDLRHRIAHGANPRPAVASLYASQLPDFFRRLGHCTDQAVRDHFMNVHRHPNPWPP